jgi:hypothetical protein
MAKEISGDKGSDPTRSRQARSGSSTYSHQPPYLVSMKPCDHSPTFTRERIEEIRHRAERRPLKPVSRQAIALVDSALKKLEQDRRRQIVRLIQDLKRLPPRIKTGIAGGGQWHRRNGKVGVVMPRARSVKAMPVRLHVPNPQHVESTIWRILGEAPANDHS